VQNKNKKNLINWLQEAAIFDPVVGSSGQQLNCNQ
jgi:hypothetical protein